MALSLVDADEVAVDVQLAHAIEAIKSTAEYELRELQTYTAALVGDMDMARDHNPFRAETYARALWASAQALSLSRGHQVVFMRHASEPLAALLRQAYAASASRLEAMGIEPAAYRTLILPAGSRRGRAVDSTYSPDLQRMREQMPVPLEVAPLDEGTRYTGQAAPPRRGEPAPPTPSRSERQARALVSSLFEAIRTDTRLPADVLALILRLHGPALLLAQHEATQLADDNHPMWTFVNHLAYEAEMAPDPADPERVRLLQLAQATIQQLSSEPEQKSSLYRWAGERLDNFLRQRLTRRCTAAASQIGALQKLEDKLTAGHTVPSTLHGTLDVPQLDTVPAELMHEPDASPPPAASHEDWLDELRSGDWVRMFLQGNWLHVQVLWPGERREIWLFGDGASDATWAVRRRALAMLHGAGLLKSLTRRSLVRRAARRVHDQVLAAAP
ncbi:MAG: DUF1631 family protein, partial [Chitinophagaceae bacterium]|nr:DUF1631 family protein [Rubrivivax sp.]